MLRLPPTYCFRKALPAPHAPPCTATLSCWHLSIKSLASTSATVASYSCPKLTSCTCEASGSGGFLSVAGPLKRGHWLDDIWPLSTANAVARATSRTDRGTPRASGTVVRPESHTAVAAVRLFADSAHTFPARLPSSKMARPMWQSPPSADVVKPSIGATLPPPPLVFMRKGRIRDKMPHCASPCRPDDASVSPLRSCPPISGASITAWHLVSKFSSTEESAHASRCSTVSPPTRLQGLAWKPHAGCLVAFALGG